MMDGAKGQRAVGAASCSLQDSYELAGSSCTSPTEPRGLPSGAPARSGSSRSGRPALLPGVLTALRVPALNLGRRACSFSCREGGRSVSQEARASAASEALEDAGSAGPRRVFPQGGRLDAGVGRAHGLAGGLAPRRSRAGTVSALSRGVFVGQGRAWLQGMGPVPVIREPVLRRALSLVYALLSPF